MPQASIQFAHYELFFFFLKEKQNIRVQTQLTHSHDSEGCSTNFISSDLKKYFLDNFTLLCQNFVKLFFTALFKFIEIHLQLS